MCPDVEYTANRDVNLPQLLERQVISVRDPRLSSQLPAESIYNKPLEYEVRAMSLKRSSKGSRSTEFYVSLLFHL